MTKRIALLLLMIALSACRTDAGTPAAPSPGAAGPENTAAPDSPLNILKICLGPEPASLDIFAAEAPLAAPIFQALYGGFRGTGAAAIHPAVLQKAPSLADGDASIQPQPVVPGDPILDSDGQLAVLERGVSYFPSGCRSTECAQVFTGSGGENVLMDQLVVRFQLRTGLVWSDGEPLDARDSLHAYTLAQASPEGGHYRDLAARTRSYTALSDQEIEWRAVPGFLDRDYANAIFPPLPEHQTDPQQSIGYGPYQVQQWVAGERLLMSRNPHYAPPPFFDQVEFVFTGPDAGQAVGQLLTGGCDLLAGDIDLSGQMDVLLAAQDRGEARLAYTAGTVWEHLDLGIRPISYDEFYNVAQGDRPAYFDDGRVRQAMAMCIDRQELVDRLAFGQGELMHTFVPPSHPDYDPQVRQYPHDPAAAIALLEQVGWVLNEDGRRVSRSVNGIPDGLEIVLDYYTTDSPLHRQLAQLVAEDLEACGFQINVAAFPAKELFDPGPQGALFGRQFDLAQFAWPLEAQPSCYLYLGSAVPGGDIDEFPYLWGGWNLTGWQNQPYDQACRLAQQALPGEPAYLENHYLAQQIFSGELPVIPLYAPYRAYAAQPRLCGFSPIAGGDVLWNITDLNLADVCP